MSMSISDKYFAVNKVKRIAPSLNCSAADDAANKAKQGIKGSVINFICETKSVSK